MKKITNGAYEEAIEEIQKKAKENRGNKKGKKHSEVKITMTEKKKVITKNDLAILEIINRFGYMTIKEIAKIAGRQEKRIYARLKTLCDYDLLNHQILFHGIPGAYWPTREGKNTCQSVLTPIKGLKAATFSHGLKVIGVYINLKERYGEKLTWIMDREIMSSRVTNAQTFKAAFQALKGKIPDGIAIYDNKKFAVEVELSLKGNKRMKQIIEDYATALKTGIFQGVLYYTNQARISKRLEEVITTSGGISRNLFRIEVLKE